MRHEISRRMPHAPCLVPIYLASASAFRGGCDRSSCAASTASRSAVASTSFAMTKYCCDTRSRTYSRSRAPASFASTGRTSLNTSGIAVAACHGTTRIATSPSSARRLRRRSAVSTYNQSLTMIQFHSLDIPQLERFLERSRSGFSLRGEGVDLDLVLRQILQKAYEFVP